MEILGCGMVHPKRAEKLRAGFPTNTKAFAWGMGIDRLAMLKYGMPEPARLLRGRHALAVALRLPPARFPDAGGRIERLSPR